MSTQFTNRQWRLPNEENKDKQSNYSMDFDASTSQYIEIAHNSYFDQSVYSFSFWINNNLNSGVSNDGIITADSSTRGWSILQDNQTLKFNPNISGGSGQIDITNFFNTTSTWIHCAITFDGTDLIVYKNGTSVGSSSSGTRNLNSNNNPLTIGNNTFATGRFFNGKIDGVSIFNYALTDGTGGTVNQIAALYGSSSTGIGNPMSLSPKPVFYAPLGDQDAFNGANYLVPNSSLKDYVFDFVPNDYVDCGNDSSLNIYNNITISAWIKADSFGAYNLIIGRSTTTDYDFGVYSTASGGAMRFHSGSGVQENVVSTGTFLNTGEWYHLAITRTVSPNEATFFINGQQLNTASLTRTPIGSTDITRIGSRSGSYSFDGKMSNIQIFNTALPATGSNSVETLYNNGSPLTSMSGFTSLQGWWKLDASATYDSSTTTWTIPDDSTNSNDGTSSGMTQANLVQSDLSFTSGYSYALDFDGTIDRINLNSTVNLSNSWSVGFWFKTPATTSSNMTVFRGNATNNEGDWSFFRYFGITYQASGKFSTRLTSGGTSSFVALTPNVLDNLWHNLVITYNYSASEYKVYLDGNVCFSGVYNTSTGNTLDQIGTNETQSWNWIGQLSNISIWNAALTSSQATEIYNEGVPSNLNNHSAYSNLVSWWQLGSNSSFNTNWTVLDEKGSNNGTSVNMTEDDIVDGVGSYANGLSSGMGGDEVIGDAPYSTANSLSVNMDVLDRVTDTPS